MYFTSSFRTKGTEIPSPLRLVQVQVVDPRNDSLELGLMEGSISCLRSLETPPSWLRGSLPVPVLPFSLSSLLSVTLQVPGSRISSEFLSPSPRRCFGPRGVSSAQSQWLSPPTRGPRAHLRLDRSASTSLRPSGARSGAFWSGGRGPGQGCGPAGAVLGAFLRQSLPGGAGGPARPPLGAFKGAGGSGEAAAAAVAAAAASGAGARRAALGVRSRPEAAGRPWPGWEPRGERAAQPEPAGRAMAKAGRAGEGGRREGWAAAGGRDPRVSSWGRRPR